MDSPFPNYQSSPEMFCPYSMPGNLSNSCHTANLFPGNPRFNAFDHHLQQPNHSCKLCSNLAIPSATNLNNHFAATPTTTSTHWTQIVPTSMPWLNTSLNFQGFGVHNPVNSQNVNPSNVPSQNVFQSTSSGQSRRDWRKKRAFELDEGPMQKQLTTEAMVTERFNHLQIGEGYMPAAVHADGENQNRGSEIMFNQHEDRLENEIELEEDLENGKREPTIVMSKELEKMCKGFRDELPDPTLQKILRPSMTVALWQPPGGIISSLIRPDTKATMQEQTDTEDTEARNILDVQMNDAMDL